MTPVALIAELRLARIFRFELPTDGVGERFDGSLELERLHSRLDVGTQVDEHGASGVGERVSAEIMLEVVDTRKRKHSLDARKASEKFLAGIGGRDGIGSL